LLTGYLTEREHFVAHSLYIAGDHCAAERVFSKVEKTTLAARASIRKDRLEALVLIQTHRDKTTSIDAVIDIFAANPTSSSRRFFCD